MRRLDKELWAKDKVGRAEGMDRFRRGARDVFGDEYRSAADRYDTASAVAGTKGQIFGWIEARYTMGQSFPEGKIDEKAFEYVSGNRLSETFIALLLYAGIGAAQGASLRTRPAAGPRTASNGTVVETPSGTAIKPPAGEPVPANTVEPAPAVPASAPNAATAAKATSKRLAYMGKTPGRAAARVVKSSSG
jgi:hypothetical protein